MLWPLDCCPSLCAVALGSAGFGVLIQISPELARVCAVRASRLPQEILALELSI